MKDKALEYIEKLCILYENGDKKDIKRTDNIIGQIYMFSHAVQGRCKNKHEDWLKDLDNQNWEI